MKRNTKWKGLVATVLSLGLLLTACGGGETPAPTDAAAKPTQSVAPTQKPSPTKKPEKPAKPTPKPQSETAPGSEEDLALVVGEWFNQYGGTYLTFQDDGTYALEMDGEVVEEGSFRLDFEDEMLIYCTDEASGNLGLIHYYLNHELAYEGVDGNFFRSDDHPDDFNWVLSGSWYHEDSGYTYDFDGLGGYLYSDGGVGSRGEYYFDGTYLTLYENGEEVDHGELREDGTLVLDSDPYSSYTQFFSDDIPDGGGSGWENALINDGHYILADGLHYPIQTGTVTANAEWAVQRDEDPTYYDGYKEQDFVAYSYIPLDERAGASDLLGLNANFVLFDRDTGYILPLSDYYLEEDGVYRIPFETADGTLTEVEVELTEEYLDGDGFYTAVVAYSFHVTCPEGYEGLMFAAVPQPETLEEMEQLNAQDFVLGARVPDVDYLDMDRALVFCVD